MLCNTSPFPSGLSRKSVVSFCQKEILSSNADWSMSRTFNETLQRINQRRDLLLRNKKETFPKCMKTPEVQLLWKEGQRPRERIGNTSFYQRWIMSHEKKAQQSLLASFSTERKLNELRKKKGHSRQKLAKPSLNSKLFPSGPFAPAIQQAGTWESGCLSAREGGS